MSPTPRLIVRRSILLAAIGALGPAVAFAADANWIGGAAGNFSGGAAVWSGGTGTNGNPGASDHAKVTLSSTLATIAATNTGADRSMTIGQLSFLNTTASPTTAGVFSLQYATPNIGTNFTVSGPITVEDNLTVSILNGSGTSNRRFIVPSASFNIGTNSSMEINPGLQIASGGLTKSGAGKLAITNVGGGQVGTANINAGTLEVRAAFGFSSYNVATGATLGFAGNNFTSAVPITGSGTARITGGNIYSLYADNSAFSGQIVVDSGAAGFNSDVAFASQPVLVNAAGVLSLDYNTTYNPARFAAGSTGGVRVGNNSILTVAAGTPIQQKLITVASGCAIDVSAGGLDLSGSKDLRGPGQVIGNVSIDGSSMIGVGDAFNSRAIGTTTINGNLSGSASSGTGGGITLQLNGGDTTVGGTVNDLLQVNGNLSLSGAPVKLLVQATGATSFVPGNYYTVLNYAGGTPNFTVEPLLTRTTFTLDIATPGAVKVVAGPSAAANLIWKGDGVANNWDIATTANFLNAGNPDVFINGDNVLFDDTSSNKTVTLASASTGPGSVTFDTATQYTLKLATGASLGGTVGIVKKGTGDVTLAANISGSTTATIIDVQAGSFTIGDATIGGGVGGRTLQIASGAEVRFNGNSTQNFTAVLAGPGTVRKIAPNDVAIGGTSPAFTGEIVLEQGRTNVNNVGVLGTADEGVRIINGARAYWLFGVTTPVTIADPITLSTTSTEAYRVGNGTPITQSGAVDIQGAEGSFLVDGNASITFAAPVTGTAMRLRSGSATATTGGTFTFGAPVALSGTLSLDASTRMIVLPAASATAPTVIKTGGLALNAPALATDNATSIDIANNAMSINYDGTSPASSVRAAVLSGLDGVVAGEVAIFTSDVTANRSIGIAEANGSAATIFGAVDANTLLVRLTLPGDANLDGTVNFDDLLKLAANYNTASRIWGEGDFNYDGTVNFDDLLKLAANYNQSLPAGSLGGEFALARASVPEPTSLIVVGLAAAGALARRRRSFIPSSTSRVRALSAAGLDQNRSK